MATSRPVRCDYCGAETGGELVPTLDRILKCTNCRSDMHLRGQWTGSGWSILLDLVQRFGQDQVEAAMKSAEAQHGESMD